jgi:hypothetical protein
LYWLAIPKNEARKFQIFAATTLDLIWFARNKLIHDAIQSVPSSNIKQISTSLENHISAWKESSLDSFWIPPCLSRIKCNFNVSVRDSFAVATAVIGDSFH